MAEILCSDRAKKMLETFIPGVPLTVRELARAFQLSSAEVEHCLTDLYSLGLVKSKGEGYSRTLFGWRWLQAAERRNGSWTATLLQKDW